MKLVWATCAVLGTAGCLPGDERPEPGSLFVTAEPAEATAQGFSTADGWSIRFDRFVTAVGDIRLHDEDGGHDEATCNDYAETYYEWLIDFTVAGREKVGLVYGLGTCSMEFRFREPSDETVLGAGASQNDLAFMMQRASDAHASDEQVTVWVRGRAERGGSTKEFEWVFRRSYELEKCPDEAEQHFLNIVVLESGQALTKQIVVHGEELFRERPENDAPLLFDGFAEADVDSDGWITLEELDEVDAPAVPELPANVGSLGSPQSLGTLVYESLLPRIARLAGSGACAAELRDRHR